MKTAGLLIVVLLAGHAAVARSGQGRFSAGLDYDYGVAGHQLSALAEFRDTKNWTVFAGPKFLFNGKPHYSSKLFDQNLIAERDIEHLGLKLGFGKSFPIRKYHVEIMLSYSFSYTRAVVQHAGLQFPIFDSNFHPIGQYHTETRWGPVNIFENYVHAGIRYTIHERWSIGAQIGGGLFAYRGPEGFDRHEVATVPHYGSFLRHQAGFSVRYRLGRLSGNARPADQ